MDSGLFLSSSHQKEKSGMTWCGTIIAMDVAHKKSAICVSDEFRMSAVRLFYR